MTYREQIVAGLIAKLRQAFPDMPVQDAGGDVAPPCARCGEPCHKITGLDGEDDWVWGHDCDPELQGETFNDMAPGWRL